MNSLQDLNDYGNLQFEYADDRSASVTFDRVTPTNSPTVTIYEGATVDVPPGIEIVEIVNWEASNVRLRILYTNQANKNKVTVSWPIVPGGCTVTNPQVGEYIIDGIKNVDIWNQIKSPTLSFANDFFGNFTYTVSVLSTVTATKTYSCPVTVIEVKSLSTPQNFVWAVSTTQSITGTPIVQDPGVFTPIYTVTCTPSTTISVTTLASTGTGGTVTFNNTTKVLTIVGTLEQVNTRLGTMTLTSTSVEVDWLLVYFISNNTTAETDSVTQEFICSANQYLGAPTNVHYYIEETSALVLGYPSITNVSADGSGSYTVTVTPSTTSAVSTMSAVTTGAGTSSFNNSTKVLTLGGTRSEVNYALARITLLPGTDYVDDFILSYYLITPTSNTATKIQNIFLGSDTSEVTNMNITRNYTGNNMNAIFATNTPFISDTDTTPDLTYTIFLNCSFGQFGISQTIVSSADNIFGYEESETTAISSNFSISGTKAYINGLFSSIKFYPNYGVSSTGKFTYTQQKNGVTQTGFPQNVSLVGTAGTYTGATTITFSNSAVWTPNYDQVLYGKADLLLVGGGGGGGMGGGGGGGIRELSNITLSSAAYSITVGAGGLAETMFSGSTYNNLNALNFSGAAGGATQAFGYTVSGGQGGLWTKTATAFTYNFSGGENGTYTGAGVGGTATAGDYRISTGVGLIIGVGGGGSSFLNNGSASYLTEYPNPPTDYPEGGSGATGIASSITGSSIVYAAGGSGGSIYLTGTPLGSPSQVLYNIRGSYSTTYGSGGGGAYGPSTMPWILPQIITNPTNGISGVVIVKIHA